MCGRLLVCLQAEFFAEFTVLVAKLVAAFLQGGNVLLGSLETLLNINEFAPETFAFGFGFGELGERLFEHHLEFAKAGFNRGFVRFRLRGAGSTVRGEAISAGFLTIGGGLGGGEIVGCLAKIVPQSADFADFAGELSLDVVHAVQRTGRSGLLDLEFGTELSIRALEMVEL